MAISQKTITEGAMVIRGILGGLFPVLTVIAYKNFLSPLTILAWSYLIAVIFFTIFLTIRKEWKANVRNVKALKDVFWQ